MSGVQMIEKEIRANELGHETKEQHMEIMKTFSLGLQPLFESCKLHMIM